MVSTTGTSPRPRRLCGSTTLTWSSPANSPCAPAKATVESTPPIDARTPAKPLFLRNPVPNKVTNTESSEEPRSMGEAEHVDGVHWTTVTRVCVPLDETRTPPAAAMVEVPILNTDGATLPIATL